MRQELLGDEVFGAADVLLQRPDDVRLLLVQPIGDSEALRGLHHSERKCGKAVEN